MTVSTTVDERSGRPDIDEASKKPKTYKKTHRENGETRYILISRTGCKNSENLVDDEIPEHGDSHASSSHEASLEPIQET